MVCYADYAATTPVSERALAVMARTAREVFGNPSSAHGVGRTARGVVEHAREQAAALLGCLPDEVYFTSGGTEADNWAIHAASADHADAAVVTSAIEHSAVLETVRAANVRAILVPPDETGVVTASEIGDMLGRAGRVALVSLMYANNETGVIQPVREAAELAHRAGALFHCDAVQGIGHVMPDVHTLGCDMLSVSGHKLHAPKGIGALYIRKEIVGDLRPFLCGGGQERRMRSGTESVPLIAAFGEACAEARERMHEDDCRVQTLRDRIADELLQIPDARIIGGGEKLPGTLNIAFGGVYGENLMLMCDMRGVCLSTGSACHAGEDTPSHVLTAMNVPERYRSASVRISIGRYTTEEEAERITETVRECVKLARA